MEQEKQSALGDLVIYGAWGFSHVVAETAVLVGWNVLGFVDPEPPEDATVVQGFPADTSVFVAIGNNQLREFVQHRLRENDRDVVSVFHPTASVSPSASVGIGCYLAEYAVVRSNSSVGSGTLLNSGSVVSHNCRIETFVTFGPNAAIAGNVEIGSRTMVGVGSSVRPFAQVGCDCVIGAGAAVIGNIPDNTLAIGVPAKPAAHSQSMGKQSNWKANTVW